MLNEHFLLRDLGVSNSAECILLPRHRWYSFKEAFSPNLVLAALEDSAVDRSSVVLDPFGGSGTVGLTTASMAVPSISLEVNPFLAFVSKTKLFNGNSHDLMQAADCVRSQMHGRRKSRWETFSTFSAASGKEKYLFNTSVLRSYQAAFDYSNGLKTPYKDLVKIALLRAMSESSNAYKDGKCLRYYRDWTSRDYSAATLQENFDVIVEMIANDLDSDRLKRHNSRFICTDSRKHLRENESKFDLCITSPPYLNSFDYTDVYRPELFLGGFVNDMNELRDLRRSTLRSHVQSSLGHVQKVHHSNLLDMCLTSIERNQKELWSKHLPGMIQAYFNDLSELLGSLRRTATERATIWLVVSTSAYAGVEVPVDLILADIAGSQGWYLREIGVLRHLRTAGQNWKKWQHQGKRPQLRESVVILDNFRRR